MAYVDDITVLIPTCDVEVCLQLFKKYGAPPGAVLNTEKTRILTSTNNTSTADRLLSSSYTQNNFIGTSLQNEIVHFSCDKDGSPLEIKNGLRVLGIPIGSHKFCTDFILTAVGNNRLQEPPEWIKRLPNHYSAIQNMHHSWVDTSLPFRCSPDKLWPTFRWMDGVEKWPIPPIHNHD